VKRPLVVGCEGSRQGEDALALGGLLARCLGAEPLVVTVLPRVEYLLDATVLGQISKERAEELFDVAREHLGDLAVSARAIVAESPGRALHELAEEVDPVALVIGSAHRGRLGRVLLGSVGSALLSGAPCPIAVAPRGYAERERRSLDRIAVASSGEAESWAALGAASALAARTGANLTLLGAVEPVRYAYLAPYPMLDAADYQEAVEAELERRLEAAIGGVPAGISIERRLVRGDPAATIAEAAEDFDLLAIGSRAYGPVRRALLGSVSARLVSNAPCPILVLPRGAGSDPLGLEGTDAGSVADPALG
jgi:nucleotide-binding universal stress UspA family protein